MFKVSTSNNWTVDSSLIKMVVIFVLLFMVYFLSFQIQRIGALLLNKFSKSIGVYSNTKEYAYQRYVYQHSTSIFAKLYFWVNNQLVSLGLKRVGVTVIGYLMFWSFVSFVTSFVLTIVLSLGVGFLPVLYPMLFTITLVTTRVVVSERMELREADIMNAVDLIVPEVHNGIKNAIVTYKDNFAPSVKDDFQAFLSNIQDRGFTFEDAMYSLSDSLGLIFKDFAQKAIYFEAVGDRNMVEIFNDITEQNRLRRQLRDENNNAFVSLKVNFLITVAMTTGYFLFLMFTDSFSRYFFLQTNTGKFLLIIMIGVVFSVLSYITTIKSKTI